MNGGRSDASTSTDDVKGPPLCLFYFTHPFGVVSPEPPTVTAAPPHIARAFLNMQPASPFFCWSSSGASASSPGTDSYRTRTTTATATTLDYDIGDTTVHDAPLSVVSVARLGLPSRRDSLCSSLSSSMFSSEVWVRAACGAACGAGVRRAVPYHRVLPPLRVPSPPSAAAALAGEDEDVWPHPRPRHPDKFSLPPIELPTARLHTDPPSAGGAGGGGRGRRRLAVRKPRRRRTDVRRVLACLMRRAVRGAGERACSGGGSPALRRVLRTIREAWLEPRTLWERCRALSRTYDRERLQALTLQQRRGRSPERPAHPTRAPAPAPAPAPAHAPAPALGDMLASRPDASPGLLHRRYSVPETIMRKYRLAQQQSDSEDSGAVVPVSAASGWPPGDAGSSPSDSPHRVLRRDRELMRKSALLRRMGARPCRCPDREDSRETRSLDGSRCELRPLSAVSRATRPAPSASPKRQRLARAPAAELSDSTYRSRRDHRDLFSCVDTATDPLTDCETSRLDRGSPPSAERLSEYAPADARRSRPSPGDDRSYADYDSFSTSMSTAKETNDSADALRRTRLSTDGHIEGRISERSGVDDDDRPLTIDALVPPYELLEIVVSETSDATECRDRIERPTEPQLLIAGKNNINIDEYVSNILVESLNSLTDQLECMNASIGGDRKISIVEKEIKVKLQNTGVNTIVHLSPTSNNQIIFGNEELCNDNRRSRTDECNNPLSIRDETHSGESNNNLASSEGAIAPPFVPLLQHDSVNEAVLQQIQKLFREELQGHDESEYPTDAIPGISHIEISNVDVYIDGQAETGATTPGTLEVTTRAEEDLIGGVGAGNYFRGDDDAAAVPRFSAFPHTDSMEVNASSSEETEALCSDCTSLVDSLDDPNSPRYAGPGLRGPGCASRRAELARSAVDVLDLLPEGAERAPRDRDRAEAFFVRIADDVRDRDEENVKVAEYMPETIKQRLYRRHRKREQRMECARRTKVKQLKKELERRRREELARSRREVERDCLAIVEALIDDVIAKIAQDEYKHMRIKRRNGKLVSAKSEENLAKRNRRRDIELLNDKNDRQNGKNMTNGRHSSNKENQRSEKHQIHGKLLARPSLRAPDRPPRRIYQKSEIHEGEKCIEILEIIEYVNGSQSSPETTNSDENHNHTSTSKCKKSRIPIPVYERIQGASRSDSGQMRLKGGDGRRDSPPCDEERSNTLAGSPPEALGEDLGGGAPFAEPRSRSNSLRFKRVFEMIPEERSSLSVDSSAEDAEHGRRVSVPGPEVPPPALRPPAASPGRGGAAHSTRSAGTSPLAEEERARRLRSQTTMTSPCSKSAATSPLRPAAPAPVPVRPAREGRKERTVEELTPPNAVDRSGRPAAGREPLPPRRPRSPPPGECRGAGEGAGAGSSSDSGDSGGSLLCSLAPRWLSAQARQRRRARRAPPLTRLAPASTAPDQPPSDNGGPGSGGWSVTVAGSCRAALPADVEMRLRFPHEGRPSPARPAHPAPARCEQCACAQCAGGRVRPALPPAPAPAASHDGTLTLTMKKEAQDSSILASKSIRKSSAHLPELETYRASRTKLKSSVKTRRGYSLHCWLPDDEPAPIRINNGLSVLGCAIIPELKPRVPTMSERDLTRVYTPRHYLRS